MVQRWGPGPEKTIPTRGEFFGYRSPLAGINALKSAPVPGAQDTLPTPLPPRKPTETAFAQGPKYSLQPLRRTR